MFSHRELPFPIVEALLNEDLLRSLDGRLKERFDQCRPQIPKYASRGEVLESVSFYFEECTIRAAMLTIGSVRIARQDSRARRLPLFLEKRFFSQNLHYVRGFSPIEQEVHHELHRMINMFEEGFIACA